MNDSVGLLDPSESDTLRAYFGARTSLPRSPDFPGDAPLAGAVARICLNAIQPRLPVLPRHLLTIRWADAGPGFSWPEAYHATYLPEFGRHVVTASVDRAETWVATDFALGVVQEREDLLRGCGAILRGWWRHQRALGDQPAWASVLCPGLVDRETALAWRVRTWGAEVCPECV